jgi:hypothetical protein
MLFGSKTRIPKHVRQFLVQFGCKTTISMNWILNCHLKMQFGFKTTISITWILNCHLKIAVWFQNYSPKACFARFSNKIGNSASFWSRNIDFAPTEEIKPDLHHKIS